MNTRAKWRHIIPLKQLTQMLLRMCKYSRAHKCCHKQLYAVMKSNVDEKQQNSGRFSRVTPEIIPRNEMTTEMKPHVNQKNLMTP